MFSPTYLVYLWIYIQAKASPGLGLQSKDWEKNTKTKWPWVWPSGLTQDRGLDSVSRKGLFLINAKNCSSQVGLIVKNVQIDPVLNWCNIQGIWNNWNNWFQRCMALTTAILVGDAQEWIHDVADKASKLRVSHCKLGFQFFSWCPLRECRG